jgi:hypothetical protein
VPEDLNDALTGHSNRTVGRSYGARAGHPSQRHIILERYGLPRLVEAVSEVEYPSIDPKTVCRRPQSTTIDAGTTILGNRKTFPHRVGQPDEISALSSTFGDKRGTHCPS